MAIMVGSHASKAVDVDPDSACRINGAETVLQLIANSMLLRRLQLSLSLHSTSSNIPFYVNAIDNALKMSLANPDIANNLVRYPIISSEYREIYHGLQWKTDK
ncbi:hypothetical protein EMCRGX_G026709 [Ephydatia muelleri]